MIKFWSAIAVSFCLSSTLWAFDLCQGLNSLDIKLSHLKEHIFHFDALGQPISFNQTVQNDSILNGIPLTSNRRSATIITELSTKCLWNTSLLKSKTIDSLGQAQAIQEQRASKLINGNKIYLSDSSFLSPTQGIGLIQILDKGQDTSKAVIKTQSGYVIQGTLLNISASDQPMVLWVATASAHNDKNWRFINQKVYFDSLTAMKTILSQMSAPGDSIYVQLVKASYNLNFAQATHKRSPASFSIDRTPNGFSIYNPFKTMMVVDVFNHKGELLYSESFDLLTEVFLKSDDLGLSSGNYYARISSEHGVDEITLNIP